MPRLLGRGITKHENRTGRRLTPELYFRINPNLPQMDDEEGKMVLRNFPGLKVCVPHLGFDEITAYRKLIEKYDTLWLDTTMMLADYFPLEDRVELDGFRMDRILYGSDFPNIPYAWDRELKRLETAGLSWSQLEWILHKSAVDLFRLD